MEPQISILRREAKEFGEKGGNETLFWAGRMSDLVGQLLRADLKNMSETARVLGQVKREYDDRILSSANAVITHAANGSENQSGRGSALGG
jgi:hypothetical protein